MKRACLLFLLGFVLFPVTAIGQVQTGTPAFGSFGGGPDIVNLGNLNAHLVIPVIQKPGRGMTFSFDLTYDSSIWTPVSSSGTKVWTPATTSWGWTPSVPNAGFISFTTFVQTKRCSPTQFVVIRTYDGWTYHDGLGTAHLLPNQSQVVSGCGMNSSTSDTETSVDGSGYTLSVTGRSVNSLTGADGSIINVYSGTLALQDRNGNEITSANSSGTTSYFDTLSSSTPVLVSSGSGTPTSPVVYTYTAPSGASASYKVQYAAYTVQTNFGCTSVSEFGATSENLVSEIDLPDVGINPSDKYVITYEATPGFPGNITGRIASITLPTGGMVTYNYTGGNNGIECTDGSTAGMTRQTPDGTWTYSRSGGGTQWTTTTNDPQGNQTVIQFQEDATNFYETQRQVYQLVNGTQTLLQTTNTCYNGSASPCTSTAIGLPISSIATIIQLSGSSNLQCKHVSKFNSFGLLTEQDDYDYGSGAPPSSPIRTTTISYATLGNDISAFPQTVAVQDGIHTAYEISYNYDETGPVATNGTPQHASVSGSRGNLTSILYTSSDSAVLKRTFTYSDTGNVQGITDVNNAQTSYNYPDATSTCGNTFPTSVNEPSGLSKSMIWNCTGAVQTSGTDENGNAVSTTYNDADFWRPAYVIDQEGNRTNISYGLNPRTIDSSMEFNSNSSVVDTLQTLDGLGRVQTTQQRESPGSSNFDSLEIDYDSLGRPSRSTVPYVGAASATNGSAPATARTYDALNRPLLITDGGGGTLTLTYTGNDVLQSIGPAPAGENPKRKQLEYNSIGQLTSVCEITSATGSGTCSQTTSATGYWTKYTYDGVGDLLTVTQNAQSSSTQSRAYTYDASGRMLTEKNPETGTTAILYVYDTDATCGTSNGDLVKKTDAAGNVTCYVYDQRHRILSITYPSGPNSGNSPAKHFVYDSATVNSVAMANAKARLAEAYTCVSPCSTKITDEGFSYTVRGEVSDVYESSPHSGGYYHVNETYWANGALNKISGLAGLPTLTYAPDGEGRPNSVSASSGQNPVTGTTYNVGSEATQLNLGSSDTDAFTFDPNTFRMTQYKFTVNSQSVIGNLTWNANGSLGKLAIADPFNAANTQTCTYSHDDLARIASGNCGSVWSQTFSYDAFGNLTKAGTNSFNPGYNYQTNQMSSGATYDTNGNVLTDSLHSYAWNSDTRPTTIDTVTVTYDALGRMVEESKSGTNTEIVYDALGNKLALMNGVSTLVKGFAPLPAGATAVYNASGLQYYRHPDWLGSSRFSSTPSRTMFNDLAYAPFGETYAQAGTTGVTNISFAGNNEDTTTNAYDAMFREYGIQGRWPSPDPAGTAAVDPTNPQSWNRYAYVLNMPLLLFDPLGLDPAGQSCDKGDLGHTDGHNHTTCECAGDSCAWISIFSTTVTVNGNPPPPDPIFNPVLNPTLSLQPGSPAGPIGGPGGSTPQFQLSPQPKKPSCFSVFVNAAQNADLDIPTMPGSNPEDLVKAGAGTYATLYTIENTLVYPLKSSVVRGILDFGEAASVYAVAIPVIYKLGAGVKAEYDANRARTCSTVF